jgi:hypothetical protein
LYIKNPTLLIHIRSAAAWGHEYVVIIERKDGKMLKVACRGYQLHKQGQYSRGVQVMHEFTPFEPVEITDSAVLIP